MWQNKSILVTGDELLWAQVYQDHAARLSAAEADRLRPLSEYEARDRVELDDMYVVQPAFPWRFSETFRDGRSLAPDICFISDSNDRWLDHTEPRLLVKDLI